MTAEVDPVGISEIAARLEVQRDTVDKWRTRPTGFPPATWTIGGRPAWDWAVVAAWAQDTGRGTTS